MAAFGAHFPVADDLRNLTFLHLDDNVGMSEIVKTILRGLGVVHLYMARDVEQALHLAGQISIDIAVVDYRLQAGTGLDFARAVRGDPTSRNQFLPIIMLSAHAEESLVKTARDAGVTEFCAKPVTSLELSRKINEVILRPRPFVRAGLYFGPDRRRRLLSEYSGIERRGGGEADSASILAKGCTHG